MDSGSKGDVSSENLLGTVAPLSLSDAAAIKEIADVCFPEPWALGDFEFFLKHPAAFHWGIKTPDRLLAYFLSFNIQGEVDVISIASDPSFRRQGLAKRLLESILDHVETASASLEVDMENTAAVNLYEKCGFTRMGIRKKYYQGKRDALRMGFEKSPK